MNTRKKVPAVNVQVGDHIAYELDRVRGGRHYLDRYYGKVIQITNHLVTVERSSYSMVHIDDVIKVIEK